MIRKWMAVAGAAIAVAAAGSCVRARSVPARPDIILISVDTLRADHLGCYGYPRPTSPNIDRFRRDGALFRTTISSASSTLPSHASLFTSLPPQHHGASHTASVPLAPAIVTIAEVLRGAGYETAAIVGGLQLAPEFGLTQGFDSYDVAEGETLEQISGRALDRLTRSTEKPRFLFLHTYQVHHPYTPDPQDLEAVAISSGSKFPTSIEVALLNDINEGRLAADANDLAHIIATYDGEIVAMDRGLGSLVAGLKRRGLYDNALVILTSDHGEEFGEHGYQGWHSHTLFEELLRVPLLVKFPAGRHAGKEIGGVMRLVDVAPMILEAVRLPRESQFQPFSLATTLARGQTRAVPVLLWRETPPKDTMVHEGLRSGAWKLIDQQLYDLNEDPRETRDLAQSMPAMTREMTSQRQALVQLRQKPGARPITPSRETIEALRSLGYVR